MKAFLRGALGGLLMIVAFVIGVRVGSEREAMARSRYEMRVLPLQEPLSAVIRLDKQTGTLHYSTPTYAGDVKEFWNMNSDTEGAPAPTATVAGH